VERWKTVALLVGRPATDGVMRPACITKTIEVVVTIARIAGNGSVVLIKSIGTKCAVVC